MCNVMKRDKPVAVPSLFPNETSTVSDGARCPVLTMTRGKTDSPSFAV